MAKNLILYFSGTGNSLALAKRIANIVGDTEIRAMATYGNPKGEYERVGFVFPCYSLGLPRFVKNYIENIDIQELVSDYYFAVETNGGWPGNANSTINKILRAKGSALSFNINIRMFANYIAMYSMKGDAKKLAEDANVEISSVATSIKNKMRNSNVRGSILANALYSTSINAFYKKVKGFNISNDCNGCGICVRLCPGNNISMVAAGKPVIGEVCEQCMACIQWCPKQAINYKTKTVGKKRYTHPEIRVDEMMLRGG